MDKTKDQGELSGEKSVPSPKDINGQEIPESDSGPQRRARSAIPQGSYNDEPGKAIGIKAMKSSQDVMDTTGRGELSKEMQQSVGNARLNRMLDEKGEDKKES